MPPKCLTCGNALPERSPNARGRKPRYCSPVCKSRANDAAKRADGRYESRLRAARSLRAQESADRRPPACRFCDAEMPEGVAPNRRYCGAACRRAFHESRDARCQVEGCEGAERARGLCHAHWRREARSDGREANPAWGERRRTNWKRRRDLISASGEKIDRLAVFDRDSWTCGICSQPVDQAIEWPHPRSASLDHVIPLALGGEHIESNVQCSHLVCNEIKGVQIAGEAS